MILKHSNFILRPWHMDDADSIVKYGNNRKIWRNLRDGFPYPYTIQDAENFLSMATDPEFPSLFWAIEIDGEAVGGIGVSPLTDVYRRTAEVGYWLGEPFWGRGIATEALKLVTDYAFSHLDLIRIHAGIYEWNPASARVLEKAGYHFEGRKKYHITKDGKTMDELMYVMIHESAL